MANAPRPKTKSYAGRQVDLEMLKHVDDPAEFTVWRNVQPTVNETPRIVAGIEKAVQRYAKTFLTFLGSVKLAPEVGNELLSEVAHGKISSQAYLSHLAIVANADTLDAIRLADGDTETYGSIPDDERITDAELRDVELKYKPGGGRVRIHVFITTAAGEGYTFVIPVASGIT